MNSKELKRRQDPKNRSIIKKEIKSKINSTLKKVSKPQVIHYQTSLMRSQYMTYCGRRNISTSVKTTFNKSEVTCIHCRKYLNLI